MFYCQNCGAKIESAEKFCSFCGFSFEEKLEPDDKDARINELEQKIARLEHRQVKKTTFTMVSNCTNSICSGFFWIFYSTHLDNSSLIVNTEY
ncbi:MAG: zinc-ribbon domain-containing protein [Promethearchaeota archaeon]